MEFVAPCDGLAIADDGIRDVYGPDVAAAAAGHLVILDFEADNVDLEYERLRGGVRDWLLPPTDQPWGNRAMLLRDPDGSLVNVFARAGAVAPEGIESRAVVERHGGS